MTTPPDRGSRPPAHPHAPLVVLPPSAQVGAGRAAAVPVRITHRGPTAARLRVTVLGLDSSWVPEPLDAGVLGPGDSLELTLTLVPARGTLGARYPFVVAVEATALSGAGQAGATLSGAGQTVVASVESELVVDSAERISMAISPSAPTAVFGKRIQVDIVNPGTEDREFELVPTSARSIVVRLAHRTVTAVAGQTTTVRGRVHVKRPSLFGAFNSHAYEVRAQGVGAPEFAEARLRSGPIIRGTLAKVIALVSVVALWAGLAIAFIPRLSDAFKPSSALSVATQTEDGGEDAPGGDDGGDGGGDGTDGAADGGGAGAGGAGDGTGTGEDGDGDGEAAGGYQLTGVVTGDGADGTTVTLAPMSLISASERTDAAAPNASAETAAALRSLTSGALAKLAGPAARPAAVRAGARSVITNEKGQFVFGGLGSSGYFLLSFTQPGYQTQRFLVSAADLAEPEPMEVELLPGTGALSGRISDPSGAALGAATVTVTDGEVTLQTSSVSASAGTGTPGSWAVDHLPTPGTYLVTASAPGFGAASALVSLDASGEAVTNLTLTAGQGVITGRVTGVDALGEVGPLGGITVTASDGEVTRTATTVTAAAARGTFILPNMPVPGTYTVQVSAEGYLTQTRTVTFGPGAASAAVEVALTRADGVIEGVVSGQSAEGADEGGLVGVGLTLSSAEVSMKTMTTSGDAAGGFRFVGVPPGTYVLTAGQFGRVPASLTIELGPSETQTTDIVLVADDGSELPATSHIRGQVVDSRAAGPLTCDRTAVPVAADACVATIAATTPVDPTDRSKGTRTISTTTTAALGYVYTLPALDDPDATGLPPGLYRLTISAPGYATTYTNVQVGQGVMVGTSPTSLPVLGLISGTVSTRIGTPAEPSCVLAVPEGVAIPSPPPSACTHDAAAATCEVAGLGTYPCALTSPGGAGNPPLGTYQIRGLSAGRYQMLLIAQDPEYRYVVGEAPVVELDLGGDAQFNAVLDRLGHLDVLVLEVNPEVGAPAPAAGVEITVTPASQLPQAETTTGPDGRLTVTGLDGVYTVAADGTYGSDKLENLRVGMNQDVAVTLVLTQPIGAVVGRVVAMVDGTEIPLSGVAVKLTGTTAFSGQTAIPSTVTVTTNSAGCYAIVPPEWSAAAGPPLTGSGCTVPQAPGAPLGPAVGEARFITPNVTVAVDPGTKKVDPPAPAGVAITVGDETTAGTIDPIMLNASPVPFGTQALATSGPGGTQPPLQGAAATVSAKPAAAGAVSLTVADGSGGLTFRDTSLGGPGMVSPGTYSFAVSALGFATTTATLVCPSNLATNPLSGAACAPVSVPDGALKQLPQISGAVTVPYPLPSGVDLSQLTVTTFSAPGVANQATVALDNPIEIYDESEPPVQTGWEVPVSYSDPQFQALGAGNHLAAPGHYSFRVSLPGYGSEMVPVTCGDDYTDGCSPLDAELGSMPRFAGSVALQTSIDMGLGHPNYADANPSVVGRPTITLTIDANGTLHWKDPNLPLDVIEPGTYRIQISKPGYVTVTTAEFTCTSDSPSCGPSGAIDLKMYPRGAGTVTVDVNNGLPGSQAIDWSAATVEVLSAPANKNLFQVELDGDDDSADLVWTDDGIPIYTGIVRDGAYSLRITVPGYDTETVAVDCTGNTGTGAMCAPGADIELTRKPAFKGTVTAIPALGDYSGIQFTVTGGPLGVGVIDLSAAGDGTLKWQEIRGGIAQPVDIVSPDPTRIYRITAIHDDYVLHTTNFTCNPPGGAGECDLGTITLAQLSTLKMEFVDGDGNPVNGPRIEFGGNLFDVAASTNVYQHLQKLEPGGDYSATIRAPGYAELVADAGATSAVSCTNGTTTETGFQVLSGTTTCTITLTGLGRITGQTVWDKLPLTGSDLGTKSAPQLSVQAAKDGQTFTVTSNSDGKFTLTGTLEQEGLAAGTWDISLPGLNTSAFEPLTGAQITLAAGSFTLSNPTPTDQSTSYLELSGGELIIHLVPKTVDLTVQLIEDNALTTPNATYTLTNQLGGSAVCTVDSNTVTGTDPPCSYGTSDAVNEESVTFEDLPPGDYKLSINFAASTYGDIVNWEIAVEPSGVAQSVQATISAGSSTVTGLVLDASNAPIPDATVTVCQSGGSCTGPSQQTRANGIFAIGGVEEGTYYLTVTHEGYQDADTSNSPFPVVFGSAVASQTVRLSPLKADVTVTLTPPTGLDLTGKKLSLHQTDADGRIAADNDLSEIAINGDGTGEDPFTATLTQIPTGTWAAAIQGAANTDVPFDLPAGSLTVDAETTAETLTVDGAKVDLSVTSTVTECVTGPTGSSTATLTRTSDSVTRTVTISNDGTALEVFLPEVAYSWALTDTTALGSNWTVGAAQTFTAGTHSSSSIALTAATGAVHFLVTLDGTAPDAGFATVTATCTDGTDEYEGGTAAVDADGEASLTLATGAAWSYTLSGYDTDDYDCGPADTDADPITFACTTVPEAADITVTVTDDDSSSPIEGATVTIGSTDKPTDANGIATFTGFEAGDIVVVTVSAPGFDDYTSGSITLDAGANSHTVTLTPTAPATADVTVTVNREGNPQEGATVTPSGGLGTCSGTTDAVGEITCTGLTVDTDYTFSATWTDTEEPSGTYSGTSAAVAVAASGSTATITLTAD